MRGRSRPLLFAATRLSGHSIREIHLRPYGARILCKEAVRPALYGWLRSKNLRNRSLARFPIRHVIHERWTVGSKRTAERCQEVSQGYAFCRTPGKKTPATSSAPRMGCEESSTPLKGAVLGFGYIPGVRKIRVHLANFPARLRRGEGPTIASGN